VRGLDDHWHKGLAPWRVTQKSDRWYGRGTADNKGQHAVNLSAPAAVLAERADRPGLNLDADHGSRSSTMSLHCACITIALRRLNP
jgi:hypothetical protein